jgi:hypothetical protein
VPHFLIGCALGGVIAACIAAPLLAPWRVRVRYLVNAPMTDPLLGLGLTTRAEMRAVTVLGVATNCRHVRVVVGEAGAGCEGRISTLTREACSPAVVAELDEWAARGTPLLMLVDEAGDAHVYGPDGAATRFSLVGDGEYEPE